MISEHPVPIVFQSHEPLPTILRDPDQQQACVPDGRANQTTDVLIVREEVVVEKSPGPPPCERGHRSDNKTRDHVVQQEVQDLSFPTCFGDFRLHCPRR